VAETGGGIVVYYESIKREPKIRELFNVTVTLYFFFHPLFVFFPKRQQNEDLTRNNNDRTEGTDPGACIGA
jgi:hypothetical protein